MMLKHLSPLLKIRNFCQRHPLRVLLATIFAIATVHYALQHEVIFTIAALNGLLQSLLLGLKPNPSHEPEWVADIFTQLKREQDVLHVKQRQLKVQEIKKVALSKLDEQQALLDFPFNLYRVTAMRFPAAQLAALQAWLATELPQAEIID